MALLLNPKVWIALALAAVLALAGAFVYKAGRAAVRADWDAERIAQQEQRILADRAREQRNAARQDIVNQEALDGQKQLAALEAERAAARDDRERMRLAIRTATDQARYIASVAARGTGEPSSDAIGMFADMLERADRRAEIVGGYADQLRAAGSTCERISGRLLAVGQ